MLCLVPSAVLSPNGPDGAVGGNASAEFPALKRQRSAQTVRHSSMPDLLSLGTSSSSASSSASSSTTQSSSSAVEIDVSSSVDSVSSAQRNEHEEKDVDDDDGSELYYELLRLLTESFHSDKQLPLHEVGFNLPTEVDEKTEIILQYYVDSLSADDEHTLTTLREMPVGDLTSRVLQNANLHGDAYLNIFQAIPWKITGIHKSQNKTRLGLHSQ